MEFDPTRPPSVPRDAAAVILVRARPGGVEPEVYLVRRTAKAAFMARAFVFPGGARDGEEDLRLTAARELLEEAGVLVADRAVAPGKVVELRARLAAGEKLAALLAETGLAVGPLRLVAHWITPSAEKRRFSARFFLAELPPGQEPSVDGSEVVEARWVTPKDALERSSELALPPPQLRTMWDLRGARSASELAALTARREAQVVPIVPRFCLLPDAPSGFALLLPWDPEYATRGQGDGEPLPADHPLAGGDSRFVLDGEAGWRMCR